jgi:dipeptidyl aminopeptidase/acylaminoacyl peptidase
MKQSNVHQAQLRAMIQFVVFACAFPSIAAQPIAELLTIAEQSDYRATARYDDVMKFCKALDEGSELVTLLEFGKTHEGRAMPLLVLSKKQLSGEKPWEQSKLPAILCIGNIHAGEVCGKEALLMLARDLVTKEKPPLLDHFVLLIAPIYNADGNEQVSKDNRPGQVGPEEGMGQRANRMGLDLNRDYVKLEAPESQAMVRLLRRWDPQVVIDTHTTNGSHHRYVLTFDGPRHPATDPALVEFVRAELLPAVQKLVADSSGYDTFFYGNFERNHGRWETYPALPRYGGHYVGLRNRISILSEAYAYAPYKQRVLATQAFVTQCLNAVDQRRERIDKLLDDADRRARRGRGEIVLRAHIGPHDEKITIKGFVEEEKEGKTAATKEPKDYEVEDWAKSVPDLTVALPSAYLLSPEFSMCRENLQRHGIEVEQLREDIELDVEASRIGEVTHAEREFEGHKLTTLEVEREPRARQFAAGTLVVRMAQPLGRLAALLLEPESEDGLVAWNFFDKHLKQGGEFPVYRVPHGQTLLIAAVRPLAEDRTTGRRVTFETLYGDSDKRVDFEPPATRVDWLPDGKHYLQTRENRPHKVDALTGRASRYPDPEKLAASLESIPSMEPSRRRSISRQREFRWNGDKSAALIVHGDDLYHLPMDGSPALRLTRTRGEEQYARYSPDGRFVAYVRDRNLYITDIATQTEQAITNDAGPHVRNGEASWVYFEEVFNRDWRAFWWSPDSRHVAFCRYDETGMPRFHALDTIPLHGKLETMAHPKAGDRNPVVALGVAPVSGAPVRWIDFSDYTADSFLVTHVGWRPDGDLLYFYVQDRAQTWLDFRTARPNATKSKRLFRETTKAWVDSPGDAWWVKDEIIILSERSGWKHLYAFNTKTKKRRAITKGEWEIRDVSRVDEDAGWIYFTAGERSPISTDWLRVRIDGSEQQRLTSREGSHRIELAPKGNLAVANWSSFDSAGDIQLINTDGQKVRTIDSRPSYVLEEFKLGEFRHVQIPADDGFQLEATLTFPPDFDESKGYPVWLTTYGGPHAPVVRNGGGPQMRPQMLANLGIIVFQIDPRSASGKGAQSTWAAYRQLGIPELADIECGVAWLTKHPYVDAKRIGIQGHSYGGFMTAYAMTHSKLFAAGISGSPVTDWRNYDSIYTERYMDTPQENPDGYKKTSVVNAADKLHGRLLLLHGLMDDNVHPQNSTQFIEALQRAKKDFRVMFYPRARHGLSGDHYNQLMVDFIKESLLVGDDDNSSGKSSQ